MVARSGGDGGGGLIDGGKGLGGELCVTVKPGALGLELVAEDDWRGEHGGDEQQE